MQLVKDPSPSLRELCTNYEPPTLEEALKSLQIMQENDGIGISAPQVGSDKRFFWACGELIINPEIIKVHTAVFKCQEGCLSLPGLQFDVLRSPGLVVIYENIIGQKIQKTVDGTEAVVFQHEYDHLFGIMIDEKSKWCIEQPA
jgi:peptide deformylase